VLSPAVPTSPFSSVESLLSTEKELYRSVKPGSARPVGMGVEIKATKEPAQRSVYD
jgi:hypothetical protein